MAGPNRCQGFRTTNLLRLEAELALQVRNAGMDPHRTPASTLDTPTPSDRSTPERVLDTAAALFWEKGYAATTTREIAAAVGIQQASLYYHVASKEGLLYQLC